MAGEVAGVDVVGLARSMYRGFNSWVTAVEVVRMGLYRGFIGFVQRIHRLCTEDS